MSCSVDVGNVHDTVSALSFGSVDLLICFHQAAHPVQLDEARFDRHDIGDEIIRPYASISLLASGRATLPGTALQPVPLLNERRAPGSIRLGTRWPNRFLGGVYKASLPVERVPR